VRAEADDNVSCIHIRVSDQGPGFPEVSLPRLFEKFYRVPGTAAGGIGLGLSIAKGFVEAHNGKLLAENQPGGGALLTITLPITETPSPAPEEE
jgi:two-component system sensor histidine kinase KdpD